MSAAGPGERRPERALTGAAGLLLLVAVTIGLVGQGAFYGTVQRLVALLVAAATLLALIAWPPNGDDVRRLPVHAALALAAWALIDAVLLGVPAAGAAGLALLLAGVVATLATCRRLGAEDRQLLLTGVTAAGLVVALTGWLGVAWRIDSLAWLGDGIWRASATLTYPNAAAAVLVPLALVALARLDRSPPPLLVVAATGLLGGLAATLSRAGAVAFVVGLAVLACLRGPRATARAAAGPCAGAVVVLAGLVPSMPAAAPPRPVAAVTGLAAGLLLAVLVSRVAWSRAGALLAAGAAVAALGGLVLVGGGPGAGEALGAVAGGRVSLASPDRTGALLAARQVVADHPLTGVGPGRAQLRWEGSDGATRFFAYAHNEYAQVAAELGLVGLALLVALLAALARLLWRSRPAGGGGPWAGAVAATAAFAVHAGFDFVWHLPAVVLAVTVLAGTALPAPAPNTPVPAPPRKELHEATT
jgi:O-Antigen ligase